MSTATGHESSSSDPLDPVSLGDFEDAAELLKALSAPVRLALVQLLTAGPRCVHELVDALGLPQPLVSQHLKTLRAAGLVAATRDGREVRYRLADDHVAHITGDALAHSAEAVR
jgi:DNA-binding transcriptional ArsR family regulator